MDATANVVTLDESNYTTWSPQIARLLEHRGLSDACSFPYGPIQIKRSAEAAATIIGTVSAHLLLRLPREHLLNSSLLLLHLEDIAKPFRFLDLSPELRNLVYEYYLEVQGLEVQEYWLLQREESGRSTGSRMPDLLQVSKQLRREFRSVYFAECRFYFNLLEPSLSPGITATVELLLDWTERVAGPEVRYMRHLQASFDEYDSWELSLDEKSGLKLGEVVGDTESQATRKHLRQTEALRKALHLKGEALMMFLTQGLNIWLQG